MYSTFYLKHALKFAFFGKIFSNVVEFFGNWKLETATSVKKLRILNIKVTMCNS